MSSLGDVIHTLPAVNLLRKSLPEAHIDWLVYDKFAGVLAEEQSVNSKIICDKSKPQDLWLRKFETYDYVIDFQGLMKTAIIARKISPKVFGFSSPREPLAAYLYKHRNQTISTIKNTKHIVDMNLDLARFFLKTINRDCVEHISFGSLARNKAPREAARQACLIPSTTWASKLWIPEYWAELIKSLASDYSIRILATPNDIPNLNPILKLLPEDAYRLVLDRKLKDLPDFFIEQDLIIGVDTGPSHIAAAACLGQAVNIIGLYGPTSGRRTGPYGFVNLSVDELFQREASHSKTDDSMKLITVKQVLEKIKCV